MMVIRNNCNDRIQLLNTYYMILDDQNKDHHDGEDEIIEMQWKNWKKKWQRNFFYM